MFNNSYPSLPQGFQYITPASTPSLLNSPSATAFSYNISLPFSKPPNASQIICPCAIPYPSGIANSLFSTSSTRSSSSSSSSSITNSVSKSSFIHRDTRSKTDPKTSLSHSSSSWFPSLDVFKRFIQTNLYSLRTPVSPHDPSLPLPFRRTPSGPDQPENDNPYNNDPLIFRPFPNSHPSLLVVASVEYYDDPWIHTPLRSPTMLCKDEAKKMDMDARADMNHFYKVNGITPVMKHFPFDKFHVVRLHIPLPREFQLVTGLKEFSVGGKSVKKQDALILACMLAIKWLRDEANCDIRQNVLEVKKDKTKSTMRTLNRTEPGTDYATLIQKVREKDGPQEALEIGAIVRIVTLKAVEPIKVKHYLTQAKGTRRMTVNVHVKLPSKDPLYPNKPVKLLGRWMLESDEAVWDYYVEAKAFRLLVPKLKVYYGKERFLELVKFVLSNKNVARAAMRPQITKQQFHLLEDALIVLEDAMRSKKPLPYRDFSSSNYADRTKIPPKPTEPLPPLHKSWMERRIPLPVDQLRHSLIEQLKQHDVAVVYGGTGSGKTTRVPQFLLDHALESGNGADCKIIVTLPRRIAVIAAATRVASERGELPGDPNGSVGYHIRLERQKPRYHGSIEFVTTGLLLRRLQNPKEMEHVSHIVIDEVHERDKDTDLLLIVVRDLIKKQKGNQKLLIMSATLDSDALKAYFGDCPIMQVPSGPLFPVKEIAVNQIYDHLGCQLETKSLFPGTQKKKYIDPQKQVGDNSSRSTAMVAPVPEDIVGRVIHEERELLQQILTNDFKVLTKRAESRFEETYDTALCQLMCDLVYHLIVTERVPQADAGGGAILCFLPGMEEINLVRRTLVQRLRYRGVMDNVDLHILHSSIPQQDQRRVFDNVPSSHVKVILATNIAETSITINDVTVVIDSGRVREMRYHAVSKISSLDLVHTSIASRIQRKGRAGRVREGICFHLYSDKVVKAVMPEKDTPEMLRCSLEGLILQSKAITDEPVREFLRKAVDPPSEKRVNIALNALIQMGAITETDEGENLTPLGWHLAALPVDPHLGRMVLMGVLFKALDPAITIAACLSVPDIFKSLPNKRNLIATVQEHFSSSSDVLAVVQAYEQWAYVTKKHGAKAGVEIVNRIMMSETNLLMVSGIRDQIKDILRMRGFLKSNTEAALNINSRNPAIRSALVCAASVNLAHRVGPAKELLTQAGKNAQIHPSSVVASGEGISGRAAWYVYLELSRTRHLYLRSNSIVTPLEITLFCGSKIKEYEDVWLLDDWIVIKGEKSQLDLIVGARNAIQAGIHALAGDPEGNMLAEFDDFALCVLAILKQNEVGEASSPLPIERLNAPVATFSGSFDPDVMSLNSGR